MNPHDRTLRTAPARFAAVYLTAIRVPELIPLVQRLAAEPAP